MFDACHALVLLDLQSDFLPGGPAAVPGADEVIAPANAAIARAIAGGSLVVATQDWHAGAHGCFVENHVDRAAGDVVDPYQFEFELQIGDGPWLGPEAQKTEVTDDGRRITLRGLPPIPCRMRVTRRAPTIRGTDRGAWVVEFMPAVDTPTTVTVAPPSPTR